MCTHWNLARISAPQAKTKPKPKNNSGPRKDGKIHSSLPCQLCMSDNSSPSLTTLPPPPAPPTGYRYSTLHAKGTGKTVLRWNCTLGFMCLLYVLKCHKRPSVACSCLIPPLILGATHGDGHNLLTGRREERRKDEEEAPGGGSGLTRFTRPGLPSPHPSRCAKHPVSISGGPHFRIDSTVLRVSKAHRDSVDLTKSKAPERCLILNRRT